MLSVQGAELTDQLLDLLRCHPEQERSGVLWSNLLAQVAQARADDMAQRDYFRHTDLNGHGPNWHLRQAGWRLPAYYSNADNGNDVELIVVGQSTAEMCWQFWMNSQSYRDHALGKGCWNQVCIGIGYSFSSKSYFGEYCVLLSCPLET